MPQYVVKMLIIGLIVAFAIFMQNWRTRYFDYQCKKCSSTFNLPVWKAVFSAHMMGSKFVRCPKCEKWTWAYPVLKEKRINYKK